MIEKKKARDYTDVQKTDWSDVQMSTALPRRHKAPMMTIYVTNQGKNIVFAMNAGLSEMLEKEVPQYKFVMAYYSKKNNAIIFDFMEEYITYSVKISTPAKYNRTFTMTPFFEHFELSTPPHLLRLKVRQEKIPNLGVKWIMYLNEAN